MKIENMEDLFLAEIEDLYDCEKRLTKALPKMAKASTTPELKKAFESHLQETQGHIERLERVFSESGKKPKAVPCEAIKGLIEEGEEMIGNTEASPLRDAGIKARTPTSTRNPPFTISVTCPEITHLSAKAFSSPVQSLGVSTRMVDNR